MKAASSEWYNTTARHVLPTTLSSNLSSFDSSTRHATGYSSSSSSINLRPHRSLSILSTPKLSRSTTTTNTTTGTSSFTSKSSRSRSNSTTEPTTSSFTSSLDAKKYKGNNSRLLLRQSPASTPHYSETENSETDVAFTEEDDEEEDSGSIQVPLDEASSSEEYQEDDDDQVYSSFKESVRMLRAVETRSRSISPAVSMRSVMTDLEEDEEDLPPDEVDNDLESTTDDDDDEDDATSTTATNTSSSSQTNRVPKSPVKVRVKVEKPALQDDQVKVTVQLEESQESDDDEEEEDEEETEEEDEDDVSEDTTTTADTVRRYQRTEGESYEEGEESTERDENDSDSNSDLLSEDDFMYQKTDPSILTSRFRDARNVSSLGDLPTPKPRIPQSVHGRSQTVHEIHSKNIPEIIKNVDSVPTKVTSSSSPSETSSRSQSARSSLVGRLSAIHKMYSVGGKLRSLSARRPVVASPPHPPPVQIQLSVESPTPESSAAGSLKATSSSTGDSETSTRMHSADSSTLGIASLAPPGKAPRITGHSRSLSAKSSARSRQFSATLKQLSLGNLKELHESPQVGLPRIVPTPPSTSSSVTQGRLSKPRPRPFLRTLTYTVCKSPTTESEEFQARADSNSTSTPSQFSSQSSIQKLHSDMSTTQYSQSTVSTSSRSKSYWSSVAHSSSQQSINEVLTTLHKGRHANAAGQVSFASSVIEHSLSTNRTKSTSENNSSQASSRHSSARSSSSSSSERSSEVEKKKRQPVKYRMEDAVHKKLITYEELQRESLDNDDGEENQLRQFALERIRKQMNKLERSRSSLASISVDQDDDEEDSGTEESEEEETEQKQDESNIPVPAEGAIIPDPEHVPGEILPNINQSKDSEASKVTASSDQMVINKSEDSWSWKEDLAKNFDDDSPIASRIPSAESGYRAMPPSPASSKDKSSRQVSLDSEELEKEKDRLMDEWKKGGSIGKPPNITTTKDTLDSLRLPGVEEEIAPLPFEASDPLMLVQGDIDLTQEFPKEERKLAVVWDEFHRDERTAASMADYDFSNLLDEMVQDVNNYKPRQSTSTGPASQSSQSLQVSNQASSSSWEQPKFDPSRKYQSLSQLVALMSHNLRLVSSETLEDHMASLISLVSSVLRIVRKNKTDDDYNTQIACLSAIRVLCDRLQEMHSSHNLKYADLSWLFRILCKYSSDSDSKIRPEASFCLARLVKVAGPTLVVRPIYFILVMESEGGGSGKTTTGAKTKAAAIDTLTYALLAFPKEDFHNLEEIAGWVCLSMLNEERRIRQSALECLAVIAQHLGRDKALPLFRTLFLREELDHFSRSPSPESHRTTKTTKSRGGKTAGGGDSVPISVHGTVRLLTGPGFPMAQPIDAISARLDKDVLPVPSTKGLIEYAVNVPTGRDLVLLMTHMLDKDDDEFDFSSSTDSLDSGSFKNSSKRSSVTSIGFSDIDWTGEGIVKEKKADEDELITADVAYILLGRGRVNKQEVVLLDIYKKEILPELLEMLSKKKKGKNRKRLLGKPTKRRRRKKNKKNKGIIDDDNSSGKLPIPTLSFDLEDDDTTKGQEEDEEEEDEEEGDEDVDNEVDDDVDDVFNIENSPVSVVVDPPVDSVPDLQDTQQKPVATTSPKK